MIIDYFFKLYSSLISKINVDMDFLGKVLGWLILLVLATLLVLYYSQLCF